MAHPWFLLLFCARAPSRRTQLQLARPLPRALAPSRSFLRVLVGRSSWLVSFQLAHLRAAVSSSSVLLSARLRRVAFPFPAMVVDPCCAAPSAPSLPQHTPVVLPARRARYSLCSPVFTPARFQRRGLAKIPGELVPERAFSARLFLKSSCAQLAPTPVHSGRQSSTLPVVVVASFAVDLAWSYISRLVDHSRCRAHLSLIPMVCYLGLAEWPILPRRTRSSSIGFHACSRLLSSY
jgi:hypothetical protein